MIRERMIQLTMINLTQRKMTPSPPSSTNTNSRPSKARLVDCQTKIGSLGKVLDTSYNVYPSQQRSMIDWEGRGAKYSRASQ
jgi:hypothetical protein